MNESQLERQLESLSREELAEAWRLAVEGRQKTEDFEGMSLDDDLYRLSPTDFEKVSKNPGGWRPVRMPEGKVFVVRKI